MLSEADLNIAETAMLLPRKSEPTFALSREWQKMLNKSVV